jgi:hypothetical protein
VTTGPSAQAAREDPFRDGLVGADERDLPGGFFDRFVFNLHPTDATTPSVVFGLGQYPGKDVVDGFVVASDSAEQRNLRFSSVMSATGASSCGPFRFEVCRPHQEWRLQLGPNPIGVEFDLTWTARTPAWFGQIAVANTSGTATAFDHLFQSGRYVGHLTVDGDRRPVDGWYGQRDRSRGVRTMSGGQGLHIWCQAQFAAYSIGFLLVETRSYERLLLAGGVMYESGELDPIVDVTHELDFDGSGDLRSGEITVRTAAGRLLRASVDASAAGGFMAGGGYGGHHGAQLGIDHVEHDRYLLDGSVTPRALDSALVDRLSRFTCDGESGIGIFEFALTRSRSYEYRPSLAVGE